MPTTERQLGVRSASGVTAWTVGNGAVSGYRQTIGGGTPPTTWQQPVAGSRLVAALVQILTPGNPTMESLAGSTDWVKKFDMVSALTGMEGIFRGTVWTKPSEGALDLTITARTDGQDNGFLAVAEVEGLGANPTWVPPVTAEGLAVGDLTIPATGGLAVAGADAYVMELHGTRGLPGGGGSTYTNSFLGLVANWYGNVATRTGVAAGSYSTKADWTNPLDAFGFLTAVYPTVAVAPTAGFGSGVRLG